MRTEEFILIPKRMFASHQPGKNRSFGQSPLQTESCTAVSFAKKPVQINGKAREST